MIMKPILFNSEMVRAILDGRKTQTRRIIKPQPNVDGFGDSTEVGGVCYDPISKKVLKAVESNGRYKRGAGILTPKEIKCPYGKVGDKLWVRETWASVSENCLLPTARPIIYKASENEMIFDVGTNWKPSDFPIKWKPSIHMKKIHTRIFLEITDIRVERVQDIIGEDILAEGLNLPEPPRNAIEALPKPSGYDSWDTKRQDEWLDGAARTMYFAQCADVDDCLDIFKKLWNSIHEKHGYGWDKNPWVWVVEFKKSQFFS